MVYLCPSRTFHGHLAAYTTKSAIRYSSLTGWRGERFVGYRRGHGAAQFEDSKATIPMYEPNFLGPNPAKQANQFVQRHCNCYSRTNQANTHLLRLDAAWYLSHADI